MMVNNQNIHAESLAAARVICDPDDRYSAEKRLWQGIPGIERTADGRLYATWYSGGTTEGSDNYVLLVRSDNRGAEWSDPLLVIDPPGAVRAYDPVLWMDPLGRLWLLWSQSYGWWNGRGGVWFIRCEDPEAEVPLWSEPRRIANGVMMNKPLVCSNGEWLFPTAVWAAVAPSAVADMNLIPSVLPELKDEARSNVVVSDNEGETFALRGGAEVPFRDFDEHMLVERRDHSLWMLVRTKYGIGQSLSTDGGETWAPGFPTPIAGPNTRFHIRRLASGRLLLLNHVGFSGHVRSHLAAFLSEDDGGSWIANMILDERVGVSYPDASEDSSGRIWFIYDRERTVAKEILMGCITENDILAGHLVSPDSFLQRIVNRAGECKKA